MDKGNGNLCGGEFRAKRNTEVSKWDLDIEPHREKMNTQDLETRFKE
jgi:hypothetical protein